MRIQGIDFCGVRGWSNSCVRDAVLPMYICSDNKIRTAAASHVQNPKGHGDLLSGNHHVDTAHNDI